MQGQKFLSNQYQKLRNYKPNNFFQRLKTRSIRFENKKNNYNKSTNKHTMMTISDGYVAATRVKHAYTKNHNFIAYL